MRLGVFYDQKRAANGDPIAVTNGDSVIYTHKLILDGVKMTLEFNNYKQIESSVLAQNLTRTVGIIEILDDSKTL